MVAPVGRLPVDRDVAHRLELGSDVGDGRDRAGRPGNAANSPGSRVGRCSSVAAGQSPASGRSRPGGRSPRGWWPGSCDDHTGRSGVPGRRPGRAGRRSRDGHRRAPARERVRRDRPASAASASCGRRRRSLGWPRTLAPSSVITCQPSPLRLSPVARTPSRNSDQRERPDPLPDDVLQQRAGDRDQLVGRQPGRHPAVLTQPGHRAAVEGRCADRKQIVAQSGQQGLRADAGRGATARAPAGPAVRPCAARARPEAGRAR